jgi:crotonobetainyl-CoA:carnitine CoA-transferase CaiB-like acyl-CoA transferase
VPSGPILTPEEALTHPHLRAREMVVTTTHPVAGDVTALGNPIKFSRTPATVRSAAPTLSADSDDSLHELGYEDEQIFRMRERGVV